MPQSRRSFLKRIALVSLTPLLGAWRSSEGLFAPSAKGIDFWAQASKVTAQSPDFEPWSRWLANHLRLDGEGISRIDYGAVEPARKSELGAILNAWAMLDPRALPRAQQMAYWINLYNALTVKVVLDHYPVASIQDIDISPGLFASGPWDAELIEVAGQALTLNDIEHGVLRPIWADPRIHYAVNCASVGCPNLRAEAYEAERLEAQLEDQAHLYVNHPRGLRFKKEGAVVSRIYDWFLEDFGGSEAGLIAHLTRYADREKAARLAGLGALAGTAYDWSLNDLTG